MPHEQDRLGASSQSEDRAATPSEPSQSSVVSGVAGIPCAFTPGPWDALLTDSETHAVVSPASDEADPWFTAIVQCADEQTEDANARLIAAAPELFEALVEALNDAPLTLGVKRKVRSALAKARGQ